MNYDATLKKWHEFFTCLKEVHGSPQFWGGVLTEINETLIPHFYNWTLGTLQIPESVAQKPYVIKDLTHSSVTIVNTKKYHDGFVYKAPNSDETITKTGLPGGFLTSNFTLTFNDYDFENNSEDAIKNYASFVFWDMFKTKLTFDAQTLYDFLLKMPLLININKTSANVFFLQPQKFVELLAEAGEDPNTVIVVGEDEEEEES